MAFLSLVGVQGAGPSPCFADDEVLTPPPDPIPTPTPSPSPSPSPTPSPTPAEQTSAAEGNGEVEDVDTTTRETVFEPAPPIREAGDSESGSLGDLEETDCILDISQIEPAMPLKHHNVKKRLPLEKKGRFLKQTVILKSGMEITYTVTACMHFATSWVFQRAPKHVEETKNPFEKAVKLLALAPIRKSMRRPFETLKNNMKRLVEDKAELDEGYFMNNCGTGSCAIRVRPDRVILEHDYGL